MGPLLFMLLINDLLNCLEQWCVTLYADDTWIYCPGDKLADINWGQAKRGQAHNYFRMAMLIGSQRKKYFR